MMNSVAPTPEIAIVDYGIGNLYSVQRACAEAGMSATITDDPAVMQRADAVLLPGVGAFGDAMLSLGERRLVDPLRGMAADGKPMIGICLGLQLFMSVSHEFGDHAGLDLLPGDVVRFDAAGASHPTKIPQVGWNRVQPTASWGGTPLEEMDPGVYMYFVHSYYVRPNDTNAVVSTTRYCGVDFCSSVRKGNIFACQFHPERSGPNGLKFYRNIARQITAGGIQ